MAALHVQLLLSNSQWFKKNYRWAGHFGITVNKYTQIVFILASNEVVVSLQMNILINYKMKTTI